MPAATPATTSARTKVGRPAESDRGDRAEVAADHRRRGVGAERHPEADPHRRADDRDGGVPVVQSPVVLEDAVDDVGQGAQRLRPDEPHDQGDDDAAGGDERDQGPAAERGERAADPVEDDLVDEPEGLVEQPDADGGRRPQEGRGDAQRDVGRAGRSRPVGAGWDGRRRAIVASPVGHQVPPRTLAPDGRRSATTLTRSQRRAAMRSDR